MLVAFSICLRGEAHTWAIEVVDGDASHSVGQSPSLEVSSTGDLHISYFDQTRNTLRYAVKGKSHTQWFITDVDQGGSYNSMALDRSGTPHFAYVAPGERGLRYATWNGSKWIRQTIDSQRIEFFNQIRIDGAGRPKISYYQRLNRNGSYALHPKFAWFDGKTWFIETVDYRRESGKMNSLALDSNGTPYISYVYLPNCSLEYASKDGDRWLSKTVDISNPACKVLVGWGSSIAISPTGTVAIAYMDVTNQMLKYAALTERGWEKQEVDHLAGPNNSATRTSLAFDSKGKPHIAYYDSGLGALKFASLEDKGWQTEIIDADGDAGFYSSLVLDQYDVPIIAYYAGEIQQLRIATRRSSQVEVQQKVDSRDNVDSRTQNSTQH